MSNPFTTHDAAWHYAMNPDEAQHMTRKQMRVLADAVAEDKRKRSEGRSIQPPTLGYQNEMRAKAGLKPLNFKDPKCTHPGDCFEAIPADVSEHANVSEEPKPAEFYIVLSEPGPHQEFIEIEDAEGKGFDLGVDQQRSSTGADIWRIGPLPTPAYADFLNQRILAMEAKIVKLQEFQRRVGVSVELD